MHIMNTDLKSQMRVYKDIALDVSIKINLCSLLWSQTFGVVLHSVGFKGFHFTPAPSTWLCGSNHWFPVASLSVAWPPWGFFTPWSSQALPGHYWNLHSRPLISAHSCSTRFARSHGEHSVARSWQQGELCRAIWSQPAWRNHRQFLKWGSTFFPDTSLGNTEGSLALGFSRATEAFYRHPLWGVGSIVRREPTLFFSKSPTQKHLFPSECFSSQHCGYIPFWGSFILTATWIFLEIMISSCVLSCICRDILAHT